jgi:hypothetical protein
VTEEAMLSRKERNHNFVRITVKNMLKTRDQVSASHLSYRKFVFKSHKNPQSEGLELEIRSYRSAAMYEQSGS